VSQEDRSRKKIKAPTSGGWGRDRMNKTHRKGRKHAKNQRSRDRRILDKAVVTTEKKWNT
jgi:hypothetical protein